MHSTLYTPTHRQNLIHYKQPTTTSRAPIDHIILFVRAQKACRSSGSSELTRAEAQTRPPRSERGRVRTRPKETEIERSLAPHAGDAGKVERGRDRRCSWLARNYPSISDLAPLHTRPAIHIYTQTLELSGPNARASEVEKVSTPNRCSCPISPGARRVSFKLAPLSHSLFPFGLRVVFDLKLVPPGDSPFYLAWPFPRGV